MFADERAPQYSALVVLVDEDGRRADHKLLHPVNRSTVLAVIYTLFPTPLAVHPVNDMLVRVGV